VPRLREAHAEVTISLNLSDRVVERLGVKLMVRTTRRITLTHESSAFLEHCQRLLVGPLD